MQGVALTSEELRKLLSCGSPEALALYLYRKAGLPLETALNALHFTVPQMVSATESLRQLGLWEAPVSRQPPAESPSYSDEQLHSDVQGSWTGNPLYDEEPVQDADDL